MAEAARFPFCTCSMLLSLALLLLAPGGCAAQTGRATAGPIPAVSAPVAPIPAVARAPQPPAPDLVAEVSALRAAMHAAVPAAMQRGPSDAHDAATHTAIEAAKAMLRATGTAVPGPALMLVIDRAPAVQSAWLVLASAGQGPWPVIGAVKVSTGKPGRKEHFRTPVGVFTNGTDILGYRAQGTVNENGIRGNGLKGMRVWDFGWQTTDDWRKQGAVMPVRLELHATDPTFLESRLGRPDSEACIRVPAAFNRFIDRYGILDRQLTPLAGSVRAIGALLPRDATPTRLAGDTVLVIDSSDPDARPSDPREAVAINQRFADWLAATAAPPEPQDVATRDAPGR